MKKQRVFENCYDLYHELKKISYHKPFIICSKSALNSRFISNVKEIFLENCFFFGYSPNPKYEEVIEGIDLYKKQNCDFIIAVGGGSAIDVAKTIKAFLPLDDNKNYLEQELINNDLFFLAVPTTAGTGSESTHFSVIYYNNRKYSVAHHCLIPDYVLLDASFLESLPKYQKSSTMLDAFCQGIESYWSINANGESKDYAKKTIKLILDNYERYLNDDKSVYLNILRAANYSGKAINISKTTAAHAMSYKLTSLYGISHGHAVACILPHLWTHMVDYISNNEKQENVEKIFNELYGIFDTKSFNETLEKINKIYDMTELEFSHIIQNKDIDNLVNSVNENRLKNNPVNLSKNDIKKIYEKLL